MTKWKAGSKTREEKSAGPTSWDQSPPRSLGSRTQMGLHRQQWILINQHSLLVAFHGIVSFTINFSALFALFRFIFPAIDWSTNEFLVHHFKYAPWLLSMWVLAFQLFYFNIYFVIDIIDIYSKGNVHLGKLSKILHTVASYVLFTIVFPLSLLISILFWTIYFWRREIMYPPILDILFPPVLNHILHTCPPPFAVIFMFISNRREPPKSQTLIALSAFLLIYTAGQINIKLRDGKWSYFVLEVLTPFQVICMTAFVFFSGICFLLLGYQINSKLKVYRKNIKEITKQYYKQEDVNGIFMLKQTENSISKK